MTKNEASVSTDNLFQMLDDIDDISEDWDRISSDMNAPLFHEYLSELIKERNIDAAKLEVMTLLSRSFTYQICSGDRIPNRNIVVRIALVLRLSLDEAQRLLKLANRGILYPKVKRDAVIIYALKNGYSLFETDELLTSLGQEPLL